MYATKNGSDCFGLHFYSSEQIRQFNKKEIKRKGIIISVTSLNHRQINVLVCGAGVHTMCQSMIKIKLL